MVGVLSRPDAVSGSTAGRLAAAALRFAVVRSSTVAPAETAARQGCGPDYTGNGDDAFCLCRTANRTSGYVAVARIPPRNQREADGIGRPPHGLAERLRFQDLRSANP